MIASAMKLLVSLSTICCVIAFVAAFAAHLLLQFYIDDDRVKRETGEPGWKIFGSVLAPAEFYRSDARVIWQIQRTGLKVFAVSIGVVVVGFLASEFLSA